MKKLSSGAGELQASLLIELGKVNRAIQTLLHTSRLRKLKKEDTDESEDSNCVDLGH